MLELLQRARRYKISGATVFQGEHGFGWSGTVHERHRLLGDAPLSVVLIDVAERIDSFLEGVGELLREAVVLVEDVEVIGL